MINLIEISLEDLPYELCYDAHRGTSMVPEKRAKHEQQTYVDYMHTLVARLEPLAKAPGQKELLAQELQRYKEGYLKRYKAVLHTRSRVMSTMVTGRAGFNTRRHSKAVNAEQRKWDELNRWDAKAIDAIKRKLKGARTEEQVKQEELKRLRSKAISAIATLSGIESGELKGFDPAAFKNSLAGALKTAARNGHKEAVRQALEFIGEEQGKLKKPVFTDRHSIWKVVE